MWGRKPKKPAAADSAEDAPSQPQRLRDAIRQARIETAERTGVVVDLRDAEVARLDLLNEALDPVFSDIPAEVDLFDRGVSKGEIPRLWVDVIAYVVMGRDKRIYRFVQDTRFGRKVLLESPNIPDIVEVVTRYVASRIVERERALADTIDVSGRQRPRPSVWRAIGAFLFGVVIGIGALIAAILAVAQP